MDAQHPTPDELEQLLAQADWLKRLARGLVRDENAAEDLVQDTWVAALRRSPGASTADLRAWLAVVVRNFARRERRDTNLRAAHEIHGARDEAVKGPDAIVARVELQRELAQALLALDEPCRSVLVLRYFDGLSASEAAKRLGISPDNARQRISRGLEKLRAQLDREHGTRGAWLAVLQPLTRHGLPILKAACLPAGVLAMGTPVKLIALGVAAALAWTLWVWPVGDRPATSARDGVLAVVKKPEVDAPMEATRALAKDQGTRAVVLAEEPVRAATAIAVASASEITGVVLDAGETPVADAQVTALVFGVAGFQLFDRDSAGHSRDGATTHTDADGKFRLEVAPDCMVQLEIDAGNLGLCAIGERRAGEHVIVHVRPPASIYGIVTASKDAQPIAGAQVSASLSMPDVGEEHRAYVRLKRSATSDARGAYRIAGLPAGKYEVRGARPGALQVHCRTLDLSATDNAECDLRLDELVRVRGTVREASSKLPIEHAEVGASRSFSAAVFTNAAGQYEFFAPPAALSELCARAPGHGMLESPLAQPISSPMDAVDFELSQARACRGVVRTLDGQPIEDAYVAAVASEYGGFQTIDWRPTHSDARGDFAIDDLRADMAHSIFVRKQGFGSVVYEFPTTEGERTTIDLGEIRLAPGLEIAGALRLDTGEQLPDAKLTLHGTNMDRGRWNSAERPLLDLYVARRESRADQAGRFHFGELSAGDYQLDVFLAGRLDPISKLIAISDGHPALDVILIVPNGLSMSGFIKDRSGTGVPHAYVSIEPEESEGRGLDVPTDPSGHFAAEGVPPGAYTLRIWPGAAVREHQGERFLVPRSVEHLQAGRADIEIVLEEGAWIRGQILEADGSAARNVFVEAQDSAGKIVASGFFESSANFELGVARGVVLTLVARTGVLSSDAPQGFEPDAAPAHTGRLLGVVGGPDPIVLRMPAR